MPYPYRMPPNQRGMGLEGTPGQGRKTEEDRSRGKETENANDREEEEEGTKRSKTTW